MDLLVQFVAICFIGAFLYTAYWIYTKVEKVIKQYRKLFTIILFICYMLILTCGLVFDYLNIENLFTIIFFSIVGLFSFFLTWCLIFSLDNSKE